MFFVILQKNKKYNYLKQYINQPVFSIISEAAEELKIEALVIGGYVRDIFMDRDSSDIDIVALGNGIELAEKVAEKINTDVKVFKNFGTAMIHYHGEKNWVLEFVGARKESYRIDSRKPIIENGSLDDDRNRRDFTINTMAISLNKKDFGKLIDPFNGINDIKNKLIKTPLNPEITFSDDPLRMMRAIRFATQLNFNIDETTFDAIIKNKDRIKIVSKERITDELNKIILSPKPSIGFNLLDKSGLLKIIFPQFTALKGVEIINGKGHKDNYFHTLEVLDKIALQSNNLWLRWAAILHDIAKPETKKFIENTGWTFYAHEFKGAKMVPIIFKHFKLPLNEKMKYVQKLVLLHLRPQALVEDGVTDSAIRRLLFEADNDIDDLMMLCKADITSKNLNKVKKYIKNFEHVENKLKEVEEKDKIRNWQPPISGDIIIKTFNIKPGPKVGIIKKAIREAILDGKIQNNYEQAFKFMLLKGKELGLELKESSI